MYTGTTEVMGACDDAIHHQKAAVLIPMGVVGECGTGVPSAGSYGDGSGVINPGIVCGVGGGVGGGAVGGGSLEAAMGCVAERMSLGSESKPIVVMTS